MWTHYANGDKGVVIGVRIDDIKYNVVNVQYDGISYVSNYDNDTPRNILSHKLEIWSYEEEVRVFVTDEDFVNVEITEIIIGSKVIHKEFDWIKDIIFKINPMIKVSQNTSIGINELYF